MKPETKKIIKKTLLVIGIDIAILAIVIGIGAALIIPRCTSDCEIRGEMLGTGAIRFVFFIDFVWGVVYLIRKKHK
ncbi:MAG: hypothetical protein WCT46_02790 [Candidatus Gracilibacteria bacterium]|jgi:hypothetical protein